MANSIPANNNTSLYNGTGAAVPTNGNINATNISASGNVTVGGYIVANGSITTNSNFVGNLIGNVTGNFYLSGANNSVLYVANGVSSSSSAFSFDPASNVVSVAGNVVADYFIGDGSQLTNLPASNYSNTNVSAYLQVLTTDVSTTGNITGNYIFGNGSQLTGLPATYGNSNVSAYLASGANGSNIVTLGNVQGTYLLGNGSFLSGITANYGNANVANYLPTFTGNLTANTISTTGNIVSAANLVTSGANGNIVGANYVVANIYLGDGGQLSNITTNYSNSNVSSLLANFGSNTISTSGNITAGYFIGNGSQLTGIPSGNLTASNYVVIGKLNTSQSIPPSVDTVIDFVDDSDPQGWYDASTKRVTPTISGYYNISFFTLWSVGSTTTNQYNTQMRKNGSQAVIYQNQITTSIGDSQGGSKLYYFNGTTDYADFTAYNGNPGATNINPIGTYFSMELVAYGTFDGNLTTNLNSNGFNISNANVITANVVVTDSNGAGTNFEVGDDTWIGDINVSDTLGIKGQQSNGANAYIVFGNADGVQLGRAGTGPLTYGGAFSALGNVRGGNLNTAGNVTGNNIVSTGNITVTYNPATAVGASVNALGGNTEGGTGYFDFLKATNNSSGATNPNKSFRINSTGTIEVINSAYTATLFSITDNGNVVAGGNVSAGFLYGDGSNITNLPAGNYSNSNVVSLMAGFGSNVISTTGNIYAPALLVTATRGIYNDPGSNSVSFAANILNTGGSSVNCYEGGVTILEADISINLNVASTTGIEITPTVVSITGNVTATGNVTGNYIIGDGSLLTNLPAGNYSNTNAVSLLASFGSNSISTTGNITAGQLFQTGNIVNIGTGTAAANVYSIAIGNGAGNSGQLANSIAIGNNAGFINQGTNAISIGNSAGYSNSAGIAIGRLAGANNQAAGTIAIQRDAGGNNQASSAIALGVSAGNNSQGTGAIAIGVSSANNSQGANSVAVGRGSAANSQGASSVAVGYFAAGNTTVGQSANAVAIGFQAAYTSQGLAGIAIGQNAAYNAQGSQSVAIGYLAAGNSAASQGANSVALGSGAGFTNQGANAFAMGYNSGYVSQGTGAIAIGAKAAGNTNATVGQGANAIAIGQNAGSNAQGISAIAIGVNAGGNTSSFQGNTAIAIGNGAGATGQGISSIAIGSQAGPTNQANNTIILNATGASLEQTTANTLTVKPVRLDSGGGGNAVAAILPVGFYSMAYNPTTGEIIYFT